MNNKSNAIMSRQEDNIVNCAKRIAKKLEQSRYYKRDGKYPKSVQIEIQRMLKHALESPVTVGINRKEYLDDLPES